MGLGPSGIDTGRRRDPQTCHLSAKKDLLCSWLLRKCCECCENAPQKLVFSAITGRDLF